MLLCDGFVMASLCSQAVEPCPRSSGSAAHHGHMYDPAQLQVQVADNCWRSAGAGISCIQHGSGQPSGALVQGRSPSQCCSSGAPRPLATPGATLPDESSLHCSLRGQTHCQTCQLHCRFGIFSCFLGACSPPEGLQGCQPGSKGVDKPSRLHIR